MAAAVLACARCIRDGIDPPHLLPGVVTNQTPKDARHHFNRDHLAAMDANRMVVHVEFPDGGAQPTFDVRLP